MRQSDTAAKMSQKTYFFLAIFSSSLYLAEYSRLAAKKKNIVRTPVLLLKKYI